MSAGVRDVRRGKEAVLNAFSATGIPVVKQ